MCTHWQFYKMRSHIVNVIHSPYHICGSVSPSTASSSQPSEKCVYHACAILPLEAQLFPIWSPQLWPGRYVIELCSVLTVRSKINLFKWSFKCYRNTNILYTIVVYQPNQSPDDPSALLQQLIPKSYLELEQDILTKAAEMRMSNTVPVLQLKEFW